MLKLADLAMREDFSLGPLHVSPALRVVKGPAGEVHVEPLTMQVFLALVDAKGQVVTRNYLYDECWGGVNVGDYSLNRAITMVRRIAAEAAPGAFVIESIPRTGYRLLLDGSPKEVAASKRLARIAAVIGAIAIIVALAGFAWLLGSRNRADPTIALAPADARSVELAHSIADAVSEKAVEYGTAFQLLEESDGSRSRADFMLKIGERRSPAGQKVELALVSNPDGSILWNWSSGSQPADASSPEQSARDTAAMVLICAAETRARASPIPDPETVKLYLGACSKFENWAGAQLALIIDAFEEVTRRAPHLRGAWAKLFVSKAEAIEGYPPVDVKDSLRKDIANSLAQGIDIPETYAARSALLPFNARFERLQLNQAGLARYPRYIGFLIGRSWLLRQVGRMDEAARTARRAAELYPQSSAASTEYANSLMQSGRFEAARSVIVKAEKLSPDAANLMGARWRLEMRYGDPKWALAMARSGSWVVDVPMISFLEARADPTEANIDRAITELRAQYREARDPGLLAQALGAFGRTEDAIQLLLNYDGSNSGDGSEDLFRPSLREVRRDPRFMQIARNFGVTDYWLRSGILPDFCYEPGLPYDCKRELARVAD